MCLSGTAFPVRVLKFGSCTLKIISAGSRIWADNIHSHGISLTILSPYLDLNPVITSQPVLCIMAGDTPWTKNSNT